MKKMLSISALLTCIFLAGCSQSNQAGANSAGGTPQAGQQGPRADVNGTIKSIDGNTVVITKRNFPTPSGSPRTDMPQEGQAPRTDQENAPIPSGSPRTNMPQERQTPKAGQQNITTEDITVIIPVNASISKQQGGRGMMGGGRPGGNTQGNSGQNGGQQGTRSQSGQNSGQTTQQTRVLGSFADLEIGASVMLWFDTTLNDGKTVKQVVIQSTQQTTPTQ